ncbi:MAG TPA: hypothetical protein VH372_22345 [Actinospica sp.]|jgi:hypothetical protein|nr:hypothetical protein [Actinospica sp.]
MPDFSAAPDSSASAPVSALVSAVPAHPADDVGPVQVLGRHALRQRALCGREDEGTGGPVENLQRRDLADAGGVAEQQRGGGRLGGAGDQRAADEHRLTRDPVGEDPAEQHADREGRAAPGDHQAEVSGGSGQLQHGERNRDGCDRVSRRRDRLTDDQQHELAFIPQAHRYLRLCVTCPHGRRY